MNPPNLSLTGAVTDGDIEAVRALLAAGTDVNRTTSGGQTPLILAIVFMRIQILSLLLEAGADPQVRDSLGLNAVDWAERRGFAEGVKLLTQSQGAKHSTPPDTSRTEPTLPGKSAPRQIDKPNPPVSRESQQFPNSDEKSRRWLAGLKLRIDEEASHKVKQFPPAPLPTTSQIETTPEKEPPRTVVNDTSVQASTTVPAPAVIASPPEHVMNVAPNTSQLQSQTDEEADRKVKEVQPTPSPPTEIETAREEDSPHIVVNDTSSSPSPTVPEPAVIASPPERLTNVSPDISKLTDQPDVAQTMTPLVPSDDVAKSQPSKSTVRTPPTSSSRKRCPKCYAIYDSELLAYCAIDMTLLVDADKPVVTSPPETARISLVWFLVVITFLVAGGFAYLMIPSFKNEQGSPTTTLPIPAANVQELPLVGGGLSGKQLEVPAPEYPASARSEHVSGTVTIRVTVDQKGRVIAVKVVEGDSRLRNAAIAAAQRATFSPEKLMNQGAVGTIAYTFKE